MKPGEVIRPDGTVSLLGGRDLVTVTVVNTGDRPVQVGSQYHFAEVNPRGWPVDVTDHRAGPDRYRIGQPEVRFSSPIPGDTHRPLARGSGACPVGSNRWDGTTLTLPVIVSTPTLRQHGAMTDVASDVITRYAEAWQRGDIAAMLDSYTDDVVAHYGGTSDFVGTHRGRDRLVEVLLESAERSDRQLVSIDQVHDDGATGAIFATESFTIGDRAAVVQRALRYRTDGERITELWLYDQDQHLVDQAWSRPMKAGNGA